MSYTNARTRVVKPEKEGPPPTNERRANNEQYNNNINKHPPEGRTPKIAEVESKSTHYLGDGSMKNPVEFREWFKILFRVWRPTLSPNEFLVAQFIFDRTAAWGKEWEIIRTQHFLNGVVGNDGQVYSSGLVITYPTLKKCLNKLIAVGAISVEFVGKRKAYALNYEWNPDEQPVEVKQVEKETVALPKPKRLQVLQITESENNLQNNQESENNLHLQVEKICTYNKEKNKCYTKDKEENSRTAPQHESRLTLLQALDAAQRRSAEQRYSKIDAWRFDSVAKAWHSLCLSKQPEANHLAVTKTDCLILHKYGKRFIAASKAKASVDWLNYLEWVIERWHTIRQMQFAWMKANSPAVPSIRFLVKFSDRFEQAWDSKQSTDRMASLPTREREIEVRVRKGIDRAVAEREVDERLGLLKAKSDVETATKALKRQQASLESSLVDRVEAANRNAAWKELRKPDQLQATGTFDDWE